MTERPESPDERAGTEHVHSAAAQLFDLRTIIALLLGVYGIVLTIHGAFFEDEAQLAKAGGIDINLWSGIVMLVVAALFALWTWWRPLGAP